MIPKIIHQTATDFSKFQDNISHLKRLNPGWEYRFYDDEDCIKWVWDNYAPIWSRLYKTINPEYGACRADLFRYLLMYKIGGVYLDIKSTIVKRLDDSLRDSDEYIISFWTQPWAGVHKELKWVREYQQWHIVCRPSHPFLKEVLGVVKRNIENYNGVGKPGVLKLTGPIAYTQAIQNVKDRFKYRFASNEEMGFKYSIFENTNEHMKYFKKHYSLLTSPVVL